MPANSGAGRLVRPSAIPAAFLIPLFATLVFFAPACMAEEADGRIEDVDLDSLFNRFFRDPDGSTARYGCRTLRFEGFIERERGRDVEGSAYLVVRRFSALVLHARCFLSEDEAGALEADTGRLRLFTGVCCGYDSKLEAVVFDDCHVSAVEDASPSAPVWGG